MADIQLIQCKNQHYIKTVSGKGVAQSIAFRVVSKYWQGVAPFPISERVPSLFAPRSESANMTLADSLPGQLAALSFPSHFAPWPFRSGRSKSLFIVKNFIQRNQSNLKHAVERAT